MILSWNGELFDKWKSHLWIAVLLGKNLLCWVLILDPVGQSFADHEFVRLSVRVQPSCYHDGLDLALGGLMVCELGRT